MKNRLTVGIIAGTILCLASTIPATAACRDTGICGNTAKSHTKPHATAKHKARHATTGKRHGKAVKHRRSRAHRSASHMHHPAAAGRVVSLITAMAPSQGVPTWFALRIAKVESNYNPTLRGAAGEYGVFQLKCATAKGIGFSGSCSALLDPRTNVQYGLKHLALAMKSSRGNLRLAASKHNGGLGRKTEVRGYVAKIF